MQAAGGVHDDGVGGARFGGGDRVVNNRGRIGAGFLLDHFDAIALRPNFELLDGSGAEGVRSAENYAGAFFAQSIGELADAGGFAGAIDADDEDDARAFAIGRTGDNRGMYRLGGSVEDAHDVRLDFGFELRSVRERVAVQLFAHGIENFARRADPEVGGKQRGFELLEERRINILFAQEDRVDAFG